MNEDRKQKLIQLLQETMENLEIRPRPTNEENLLSIIDIPTYKEHLQQYWQSHSEKYLWVVMAYEPYIVNEIVKSKLLDFIRVEFAPFIDEDKILSASLFLIGGLSDGFPLDDLLMQFLKITIVHGIEEAILTFDRCTKETQGSFQHIALLEGIKLESEMQVFDGIRLIPLSNSTSELPRYLRTPLLLREREGSFIGKTLLIVNCSVSPIFHKPIQASTMEEYEDQENKIFQIETNSKDLPNFKNGLSQSFLCQALSLACNSEVKITFITRFLAEDKLYNLGGIMGGGSWTTPPPFGNVTEVGQIQIEKAKSLYRILAKLKDKKKLQIAIDRWIKSTTNKDSEDKIIDLGIAFESLYLSKGNKEQLSLSLRLRAAWFLGKDRKHRKQLYEVIKEFYNCRSTVVHGGEFKKKTVTIDDDTIPMSEFITRVQDLCRDSIIQILKDGKFPDNDYWDDLILGE